MSFHLSKKSILKKTAQVSMLTLLSRVLGIMREFLMVRYFGVGAISDAFIASFRIPNFFRHVFAEGALSASFVPAFVKSVKHGDREEANGLMSLAFVFFEGIILLMYLFVLLKTELVIGLIAPGFSAEQVAYAIPFLQILFAFLLFISSSALLAGALNSVNHFFIPAFATPLLNVVVIITLLLCLKFKLPATILCSGFIVGAIIQFILHLVMYFKYHFAFGIVTKKAHNAFKAVLTKFLPCLFGVSIVEINLFASGIIASYLPKGSISLLYYGARFMNIPLGMFAVAMASIMLPHFSRLVLYAPKRLNFYLLEVAKFVTWVITPALLFLIFISKPLFIFLLGDKGTPLTIHQGGLILTLYTTGLLFLCMNKLLLSMFYALKDTWATTIAAGVCALINISGDLISYKYIGAYGIAISNTISGFAMTIIAFMFLERRHKIRFYVGGYLVFLIRYLAQLSIGIALFLGAYYFGLCCGLDSQIGSALYWLFITGLGVAGMSFLYVSRRFFGLKVYFLSH